MTRKPSFRFPDDPFAEREHEKYPHPLPSREYIMQVLAQQGVPMDLPALAQFFHIDDEEELSALGFRMRAMERDGQVMRNRRGDFGLVNKMDLVRGRIIGHHDGFGFLVPDEGGEDVFLSPKQMRSLLHGDRAVVRLMGVDRRGRREGALVEVLERANKSVVGRFVIEHGVGFVIPNNKRIHQDIVVPVEFQNGATDRQIVVVELVEQPSWRAQPIGRVVEVLGDHMAPGMEIDIAMRAYELPNDWPQDVLDEVAGLSPHVREEDKAGREDIRHLPLVTIDGEDARDFDDAVYCEKNGRGWRLIVAIADVSHYVRPGTALDREAFLRGNSVYFPGRVIPMLPEILSNGLCSINPNVDRLCMVCDMEVTFVGRVKEHRFYPAVMRSHARMTYTEVADIVVEKKITARDARAPLLPHLDELYELYQALRKQRDKRGAIDFETTETKIVFGDSKKIEKIVPVERNDAHRLIEECMISANVAAASFMLERKAPTLFRVHAGPGAEKLTDLREFLAELGLKIGGRGDPEPKHYAALLTEIRGRPDAQLIQTVLLRSLSQAVYTPENLGHFGLAVEGYSHFTSPIRRYPDLLLHRGLRAQFKPGGAPAHSHDELVAWGEHCSMTERRADEATRDAVDWLKCEYMRDRVGDEFDGVISSVTSFGLFVMLKQVYVEGLVHVTSLQNDYYHYDQSKHRLVGERSGKAYRLSDSVRVKIMRVNLDEKKLDFELVEAAAPAKGGENASDTGKTKSKRKRKRR